MFRETTEEVINLIATDDIGGAQDESLSYRGAFAYYDRQTALGHLRTEWRIRPIEAFTRDALAEAWGPDWQRYRPHTTLVLEQRYIRRGVEEPWKPAHTLYEPDDALQNIDSKATIVDPRLARIEARHAAETEAKETARVAREEKETSDRMKGQSDAAFRKLLDSPKDREWAIRWNALVETATEEEKDRVRSNANLLRMYDAVMSSRTVPAKRKAFRAFLAAMGRGEG